MKLIEAIQQIAANIPEILTMDEAIYIRGRKISPDASAKIASSDEANILREKGWRMMEYVEFIQEDLLDEATPEQIIIKRAEYGLREDQDALETLRQVITATGAAGKYGVKADTIRDACQKGQILALKSGDTWLMLDFDAKERWER